MQMRRPVNLPRIAVIICVASLALAVTGLAQTSAKPAETGQTQKKSAAALKAEENYKMHCLACHLADGKGLTPDMSFTDGEWKHGSTPDALAKTIREGVKGTLMLPFKDKLSEPEIVELAKLVKSLEPKKPAAKTKKQ
jgi:mono/diheme cytochrome c family protein